MRSSNDKVLGVLFLLIFLTFSGKVAMTGEVTKKVAFVGKTALTEKDVYYKIQIEKAYGNERTTREIALIALINDLIEHEIGAILGVTVTRNEIDSFKRHVDEQTKAPEILQKVKLTFGNDTSSYERIYLAPKIMNWKLHDFYSRSPEIHKKERSLIEQTYRLVVSGKGFQEAAEECGIDFSSITFGEKRTSLQTDPLIPILDALFPGEIYRNIVEDDDRYRIIRLVERNGQTYSVEAITINKQPFDTWFRGEAAKIEIEIMDLDLKNIIKAKYPGIWWMKK